MSASTNRADLINRLFKVAKKRYEPIKPPTERSVMEHLLYACCLEDSEYVSADEVFARLQEDYFDWNEVRVTTTVELAEVMKSLYDANAAAFRLRRTMHGMFEAHYQFDLEFLKKENLGKAIQILEKYRGITPFVVSYTAQAGLAGHSIPVDEALLSLLFVIGAISESEFQKRKIPGLSRVVSKANGIEFASVAHQLAAAFHKSPHNKELREVILKITPDAKERFPKRGAKKKVVEPTPEPVKKSTKVAKVAAAKAKAAKKSAKKATAKPAKKAPAKKKPAAKKAAKKKTGKKKAPAKKSSSKKSKKAGGKKSKKKSPTKRLARKKPR